MPAPLGKTPTKKMPKIEVFGLEDSQSTRAAVRFFRERRIVVRFVDLRKKPIDPAELRHFMDRLGATALVDADLAIDRVGLLARIRADRQLAQAPAGTPRRRCDRRPGRDDLESLAGSGDAALSPSKSWRASRARLSIRAVRTGSDIVSGRPTRRPEAIERAGPGRRR
jgi:hypothetical protein